MNIKLYSIFFLFICNSAFSQTQLESNQIACNQSEKEDKMLNDNYNSILKLYKGQRIFIETFKKSQTAWIKFRDSHLEAIYPSLPTENKFELYGSSYTSCRCLQIKELTMERNKQLRIWINGIKEGDTCSGSVRFK